MPQLPFGVWVRAPRGALQLESNEGQSEGIFMFKYAKEFLCTGLSVV